MANQIHFKLIETNERVLNETHELWETWQVPQWLARRAKKVIKTLWGISPINEVTQNTIEFVCATGTDVDEQGWIGVLDGAWDEMLAELEIDDRTRIVYSGLNQSDY